jgi:hypothetical protein
MPRILPTRSGVLGDGVVSDVVAEDSRKTVLSRILRLGLSYHGAPKEAPNSLILKIPLPERADRPWGRHEVAFYTQVAPAMSAPPVPRCFDAGCEHQRLAPADGRPD